MGHPKITSGSAMAEGPRDALVSRNSATTFSRFRTILECDRQTQTDGRTDTRRQHVSHLA